LEQKTLVKDFFEGLASGSADLQWLRGQALALRCDLDSEHLVLQATPWTPSRPQSAKVEVDWRELATRMEARLKLELPKSLFDQRDNSMRALLRVSKRGADSVLAIGRNLYQSLGG